MFNYFKISCHMSVFNKRIKMIFASYLGLVLLLEPGAFALAPNTFASDNGCLPYNTSDVLDILTKNLKDTLLNHAMDPYPIEKFAALKFEYNFLSLNHGAVLITQDGWLQDLTTLYINKDFDIEIECAEEEAFLTLPLNFTDIMISFDYRISSALWNPFGIWQTKTTDASMELGLSVNITSGNWNLIQNLTWLSRGTTKMTFTDMGVIENAVTEPLRELFTTTIIDIITDKLQGHMFPVVSDLPPLYSTFRSNSEFVHNELWVFYISSKTLHVVHVLYLFIFSSFFMLYS